MQTKACDLFFSPFDIRVQQTAVCSTVFSWGSQGVFGIPWGSWTFGVQGQLLAKGMLI